MIHDTRNPLTCCPRCYGAELAGRRLRQPVFRYDKADEPNGSLSYHLFHGEQSVATLSRTGRAGPDAYAIDVDWDENGNAGELRARTLREARALAEEAYIAVWRDGRYTGRGPVHAQKTA